MVKTHRHAVCRLPQNSNISCQTWRTPVSSGLSSSSSLNSTIGEEKGGRPPSNQSRTVSMSGCAPPFLRSSLNNKAKIKLKNTESNVSTESLPPGYFDQQLQNILVKYFTSPSLSQQRSIETISD